MYKNHNSCRACGDLDLVKVADFGPRPLANAFRFPSEQQEGCAPLEVMFCRNCNLAQLSVVVDPRILYNNYPYVTSNTVTMKDHFCTVSRQIERAFGKVPTSVLEIGSNTGAFLSHCKQFGVKSVLGVEPDKDLAESASKIGIKTLNEFWPYCWTGIHDVIVARHVFAHVDDWCFFISRTSESMHKDSILWIEVPYVQDMLDNSEMDTVYHEHLSYVNLKSIETLLSKTDLVLNDVKHYDLHGGCVALVIRKRSYPAYQIKDENLSINRWIDAYVRSNLSVSELRQAVLGLRLSSKKVCGYGASAKSSFWVHSCKFTNDDLEFICDDTPQKQNRYSPGTQIPIVPEDSLLKSGINYAVCFAWNFLPEIMMRQRKWIDQGGKFIVPIPSVKIVP